MEMKEQTGRMIAVAILVFSGILSGWILWAGRGPVEGAMREIETEEFWILQRAEGRWYAPNYWDDYKITRKDLTEATWIRSRDEGIRPRPESRNDPNT
jgi:hypothetical protein